jgi:hypothetical protein
MDVFWSAVHFAKQKGKKGKANSLERELGVDYHQYGFDMQFIRRYHAFFLAPMPVDARREKPEMCTETSLNRGFHTNAQVSANLQDRSATSHEWGSRPGSAAPFHDISSHDHTVSLRNLARVSCSDLPCMHACEAHPGGRL